MGSRRLGRVALLALSHCICVEGDDWQFITTPGSRTRVRDHTHDMRPGR